MKSVTEDLVQLNWQSIRSRDLTWADVIVEAAVRRRWKDPDTNLVRLNIGPRSNPIDLVCEWSGISRSQLYVSLSRLEKAGVLTKVSAGMFGISQD